MISLNIENRCLIELIKASLFGATPVIHKAVKWERVLELAKAQCIVPLIASHVPVNFRKECLNVSYQNKAYLMKLLYELDSLVKLLNEKDIPFVILKGTSAAIYYPAPSLRMFGDIDFLVPDNYVEITKSLLKENGYIFDHSNERHYVYIKNDIEFELHTRFSCEYYGDVDHIVLNGLYKSVNYKIANCSFPGLPSYENGLVLLGHIMQHLHDSGIGLRQIIDWMMFVYTELDNLSWDNYFRDLAAEAGLEKLAKTVTFMCKKWLGLSAEFTWCDDVDEKVVDQLMIRVLDDGNFGHDRSPHERVKESLRNDGVFKYLQRAGMINWPLAQKYIFLRPFAWIYQLFRYVVKAFGRLFSDKKVFSDDINSMGLDDLLKRLK